MSIRRSTGTVALAADSSGALDFTALPNVSLGASVFATYSGTLTPGANGFLLGGGNAPYGSLQIFGAAAQLTVASVLAGGAGLTVNPNEYGAIPVVLTAANTYTARPRSISIP